KRRCVRYALALAGWGAYHAKDGREHMNRRAKITLTICFAVCLALCIFIHDSYGDLFAGRRADFMPAEKLLYPITDNIDLTGKDYLEFRWVVTDLVRTDYFDFRLYKGYNTTAPNLIFKKRFSADELPARVEASLLEVNQVYTWTLVQVFNNGYKGDKSYSPFKIVNK
ncbi:MAG: hypothetical protein PHW54_06985, partial [Candidatus Omnitrophica bacterium]|nr:hypothetical protein [Candidatus Omnitrophota bacterium]